MTDSVWNLSSRPLIEHPRAPSSRTAPSGTRRPSGALGAGLPGAGLPGAPELPPGERVGRACGLLASPGESRLPPLVKRHRAGI